MKQPISSIRRGKGDKTIIFVHGNMASAKWWRPVMSLLDREVDMLAVNLRGFGDSPATPDQVTLADHVRDIEDLADALGITQFVVVGHSLGSGVAMQFAADKPERLAGMVLVDATPLGGITGIDYNLLQMVVNSPELATASLKSTLVKELNEDYLQELLADAVKALPAVIPNTRALEAADFTGKAQDFAKPVLVLHGEQDLLVPLAEAEKTAQAYPRARLKVLPGVGHNPQVEDPAAFTAALRKFINQL